MYIIRPIQERDLGQLVELANYSEIGLTTLPHDYDILKRRVRISSQSFAAEPDRPGLEQYLFVLEDTQIKEIIGTCGIISRVGGFDPFYTYEIKTTVLESKALNVQKKIDYLQLLIDHNGPTEIGTLFLHPQYRKHGLGRFLSLSRFLFIAQYRQCFKDIIITEMRGVIDSQGRSPFWEALGKHFFDVEFQKADLMVMQDKSFIADLMPTHPIYIILLPQEAQEVVGKVHCNTEPAKHLLEQEGFSFYNQIDIFEAGPLLRARVNEIRTVKESQEAIISKIIKEEIDSIPYIVSNVNAFKEFCVIEAPLLFQEDSTVILKKEYAQAIGVKEGSKVRVAPLFPSREGVYQDHIYAI